MAAQQLNLTQFSVKNPVFFMTDFSSPTPAHPHKRRYYHIQSFPMVNLAAWVDPSFAIFSQHILNKFPFPTADT